MSQIVPFSLTVPTPEPITQNGALPLSFLYDYGAMLPSETILAHAYGDVTGALLDFKQAILRAQTVEDAVGIANLLRELMVKTIEMEDLALKTADLLSDGSAA